MLCKGRPRKFQRCVEREKRPPTPPINVESIQQHLSNTPNDLHGVCPSSRRVFRLTSSTSSSYGQRDISLPLCSWKDGCCVSVYAGEERWWIPRGWDGTKCVLGAVAIVVAGWCRLACLVFFYIKVHKRMLTESHIYVKSRKISTCELYDTN